VILGGSDGGDDLPDDVTRFGQVWSRLLHIPHGFLPGPEIKHEKTIRISSQKRLKISQRKFVFYLKTKL
jgi:hypothetical protein